MPITEADRRWLAAAAALAGRGRPSAHPNPAVGAILVREGRVIARGWTQASGRPHAEAVALELAGEGARGATLYVTLEPCAHSSPRGPACADLVAQSGIARLVAGMADPDPRTAGAGLARVRGAGIVAELVECQASRVSLAGYLSQRQRGRPFVTLKLALSLDGCLALADGTSRWITGPEARAHAHALRARIDAIVVGGGTLRADAPRLDVRLPGVERHVPQRLVLTRGAVPDGWRALSEPQAIHGLDAHHLLVEGGAGAAAAFLRARLVDRLLIYRAPILIGGGRAGVADLGLGALDEAHGRWQQAGLVPLGNDRLEVYEASPCSPG